MSSGWSWGQERLQGTHEAGEGTALWLGRLKFLLGTQWCPYVVVSDTELSFPCIGGQEGSINCDPG